MKDIFAVLWTRFKPSPFAIVSILYLVCCVVNGVINASLYHRLAVATSLADSQADTIATLVGQRDGYQMQIDYHVDNTPPQADELPIQRMPVVATNSYTVPATAHHHRKRMSLYQLCRANHGTRSQCKAEAEWAKREDEMAKHGPMKWPVIVGPAQIVPGSATLTFQSSTGGMWTCPANSPAPFPENCYFRPDFTPRVIGDQGDRAPIAEQGEDEGMELHRELQTTGPMPVKACDLEHCEVVNGTWTLNPATTSDGSH